ncbi:MAG: transcriptional regulator [Methylocystis sp.]|uniref:transcriptional regulator n=1 Tax=Methylocystis sp. TaxID=1911079 RepID=UPI003DA5486B
MDNSAALTEAIELCGSQAALAARIGVKQQLISFWLTKSKIGVPAEYVLPIERATGGVISRHALRPDIYPIEVRTSLTEEAVR